MKKTFEFEKDLDESIDSIWNILKDPSTIVMERNTNFTKNDNLNWQELPSNGVYNKYNASLDEHNHTLHIVTHNSKWDSESNDIIIKLSLTNDNQTHIHVSYQIGTTAIFNIIAIEVAGEKLAHHASHIIFKNIEKQLL